jgi:hypothetical protein
MNSCNPLKAIILSLFALMFLNACASDNAQYADNQPTLVPNVFFKDKLCAWGTVHGFDGAVTRRFVATIDAKSTANNFTLDENFLFDDGERQTRVWQFNRDRQENNVWIGTAGDVEGQAKATFHGHMMHLVYQLNIINDGEEMRLNMDDSLHLINNTNMLGKTIISKFGISVGEINIMIQKQSANFKQCSLKMASQ